MKQLNPFKIVVCAVLALAIACSANDPSKTVSAATVATVGSVNKVFGPLMADVKETQKGVSEVGARKLEDHFAKVMATVGDEPIKMGDIELGSAATLMKEQQANLKILAKRYPTMQEVWRHAGVTANTKVGINDVRDGFLAAHDYFKNHNKNSFALEAGSPSPAPAPANPTINCKDNKGAQFGCSIANSVACAFAWVPIFGAIACAVTTACTVATTIADIAGGCVATMGGNGSGSGAPIFYTTDKTVMIQNTTNCGGSARCVSGSGATDSTDNWAKP